MTDASKPSLMCSWDDPRQHPTCRGRPGRQGPAEKAGCPEGSQRHCQVSQAGKAESRSRDGRDGVSALPLLSHPERSFLHGMSDSEMYGTSCAQVTNYLTEPILSTVRLIDTRPPYAHVGLPAGQPIRSQPLENGESVRMPSSAATSPSWRTAASRL
jgi:hypothetical protein